ncbi:MAG: hypothetical protein BWX77_00094 [Bacteroidetes bacterium ADurb.Bin090]|nr:MAG: hypothetical protein BWX77_00094 [Bacteroidetes bacterium ADurb.Bin090]
MGKAGIYVTVGNHALFGQACRKGDGMSLGYANVEYPVGETITHFGQTATGRHSRCYRHYFIVFFGQLYQGVTKNILKPQRLVFYFVGSFAFAGLLIESTRCMVFGGILFGCGEAFAFGGTNMQYFGPFHVF